MDAIASLPPSGNGFAAVADIARRRAQGWQALERVFSPPTSDWVADLRSGQVRRCLEVAVGWREGELSDFGSPVLVLGTFERSSRRRTAVQDLERLTSAHDELASIAPLEDAGGACELLQRLCADEAPAWVSGKLAKARDLRMQQSHELRGEAGEVLRAVCAELVTRRPRQPYLALAQLGGLWTERERAGSSFAAGT